MSINGNDRFHPYTKNNPDPNQSPNGFYELVRKYRKQNGLSSYPKYVHSNEELNQDPFKVTNKKIQKFLDSIPEYKATAPKKKKTVSFDISKNNEKQ